MSLNEAVTGWEETFTPSRNFCFGKLMRSGIRKMQGIFRALVFAQAVHQGTPTTSHCNEQWDPDQGSKRQSACSCSASLNSCWVSCGCRISTFCLQFSFFASFFSCFWMELSWHLFCYVGSIPRGSEEKLSFTRITINLIQVSRDLSVHFFLRHEN